MTASDTCILLRTHKVEPRDAAFLARLGAESAFATAVVADERRGVVDTRGHAKISLTRATAGGLGLHCPPDFAWRCGDYALYLARAAMPHIRHFWLIEPDVRPAFRDYGAFFRHFAEADGVDLIGFDFRRSDRQYYWFPTMRQRTPLVYRSLFALGRFSAAAIDLCRAERQRDRGNVWARLLWPNDEVFTTTVLVAAGRDVRDANTFGTPVYTPETFGFHTLVRGEEFDTVATPGLVYHPVLWGEEFDRKKLRKARGVPWHEAARLKVLRGLMVKRYHRHIGLLPLIPSPPDDHA